MYPLFPCPTSLFSSLCILIYLFLFIIYLFLLNVDHLKWFTFDPLSPHLVNPTDLSKNMCYMFNNVQ